MDGEKKSNEEIMPTVTGNDEKQLPPETSDEARTRFWIVASFWAVILFLGLPHWIWTTSIHRSDLPLNAMDAWAAGSTCPMLYPMGIRLSSAQLDVSIGKDLASRVQTLLNDKTDSAILDFRVSYEPYNDSWSVDPEWAMNVLLQQTGQITYGAKLDPVEPVLQIEYTATEVEGLASSIAKQVHQIFAYEEQSLSHLLKGVPFATGKELTLAPESQAVLDARTTRVLKYSSTYHITFSLVTSSAWPSGWEIDKAIQQYMEPLISALSNISQFTIDTQVHIHASPSPSIPGPQSDSAIKKWLLQHSDLSGFINSAEWPLNPSIGTGPTVNFVLYIPSPEHSPLEIANGGTGWLIPQWGGVQILNPKPGMTSLTVQDLEPVMLKFAEQLTSLVGVPPLPHSLAPRLSGLARERASSLIISTSSTLGALSRLTLKLTSIAIPDSVTAAVKEALSRLEHACRDIHTGKYDKALENARIANDEAEHAFFEPSMVGQVYFPDEHKVAVYVPLLGPMSVPLIIAAIKQLKRLKEGKVKVE